jgi:hypothetical protein
MWRGNGLLSKYFLDFPKALIENTGWFKVPCVRREKEIRKS